MSPTGLSDGDIVKWPVKHISGDYVYEVGLVVDEDVDEGWVSVLSSEDGTVVDVPEDDARLVQQVRFAPIELG